jgi:hypothetical protein
MIFLLCHLLVYMFYTDVLNWPIRFCFLLVAGEILKYTILFNNQRIIL